MRKGNGGSGSWWGGSPHSLPGLCLNPACFVPRYATGHLADLYFADGETEAQGN